jgi:hypothetical protein
MATKTIKFKIINNLQINDEITYQIWKVGSTRITYSNGLNIPTFKMATVNSAINNVQLGATKEQTMLNLYNAMLSYNYSYTGLTYTYNGTDEITIDITNADGFEHIINVIIVPNNIIVSTATPCSTAYLYNLFIPFSFITLFSVKKDDVTYFTGSYPNEFDAEVPRNALYNLIGLASTIVNINVSIPKGLTSSDVSHTLNNNSALITITPFNYFNYTNYYFNLENGPWQTTRDIYGLLPNTTNDIDIIDKWGCKLDYPIVETILDFGFIARPQVFVPVYNPMYYKFALPNFQETGFRYLINLTNEITGESIANFNVIPDIDGTGYIDVSKYLSNFTTVDYDGYSFGNYIADCKNSYIKYQISLGYEINEEWNYLSYTASTVNNINYTQLVQNDQITPNTFAVGDQISITTLNGLTAPINGLHTVLAATPYTVTIDVLFPGTSSTPVGGSVKYSDNRKTKYNDVYILTNNYAWNGALDWKKYRNYDFTEYLMLGVKPKPDTFLLTSMKPYIDPSIKYYATLDQDFYFNFAYDRLDENVIYIIRDSFDNNKAYTLSGTDDNGLLRQFKINIGEILQEPDFNDNTEWLEFHLENEFGDGNISYYYRIYVDRRCTIEDYQILFMDRHGSLLSYAFQLRAKGKGKVERDMYNKYIDYSAGSSLTPEYTNTTLQLRDAGKTIYNVDLTEELELNTNWMNDEMSVLFDELITSPYTWIKVDGTTYPCIVKENDFEVQRQKNKNLIRKTVTVEYGNKNIINI